MSYGPHINHAVAAAQGRRIPLGFVFMLGARPADPMRSTRDEALRDAVEANEAFVDLQYKAIMKGPLTWVAAVWP